MSQPDASKKSSDYVLGLVTPAAGRHIFASLSVADVGTGTGVWLADLSDYLPKTARLWGSDIDISQVPPKDWLPSNMSFEKLDILQDIPKELESQFDLVHIRLFAFVLQTDEEVTRVVRNVFKMLKPGGWIQWQDADRSFSTAITANDDVDTTASMRLVDILRKDSRVAMNPWPDRLGDFFKAEGLQDIDTDHYLPGDHGTLWLRSSQELVMALFHEIQNRLPPGDTYDDMSRNLHLAVKEAEKGVMYQIRSLLWIGRKPHT